MTVDRSKMVESILDGEGWDTDWTANYEEVEDPYVYIMGFDPGQTTGFAVVRINPNDPKSLPELIFLDQIEGGRYGFKEYFARYYQDSRTILVSEQWKEHNQPGVDREPQYIEGSMHMLWGDENIEYQYPEVKSLVPDEFLIEQGVWTPGKRHQMDALIHVLVYLRNGGQGNEGVAEALGGGRGDGEPTMGDISDFAEGNGEPQEAGAEGGFSHHYAYVEYDENHTPEGPGGGGGQGGETADYVINPEKRSKRELDGAFMGFASDEMDKSTESRTLLDD